MPEPGPPLTVPVGTEYDLWVSSIPIDGLLLGPPSCEPYDCASDLPGEDCAPEGMEIVVEYRELLDPLAWFDDDPGEWVLFDECCWPGSGIVCSALCDEELPSLVTIAIESSDPDCCLVGRYLAVLNGDDCDGWFLDLGTFCGFGGTLIGVTINTEPTPHLVFVLQSLSGSVSISIDLDGQCVPFSWTGTGSAGAYCDGETITVTVTRGSPSGCEVWGLMRWLNMPVGYAVGEEECHPAPEECCLEDPIRLSDIDGGCEWAFDCEISRRLYLLLYDSDLVCLVPEGYEPVEDQVVTLDYSAGSWSGKIYCDPYHIDSDCYISDCVDEMNIILTPICPGDLPDPPEDVCPGIEFDPPLSECATPVQWWRLVATTNVGFLCTAFTRYHYFCTPCNSDPFTLNPTEIIGSDSPSGSLSCVNSAYIEFMCGNRNARAKILISE